MTPALRLAALMFAGALALCASEPANGVEYPFVGFDKLASFNFTPPDTDNGPATQPTKSDEQIPAAIKAPQPIKAQPDFETRRTRRARRNTPRGKARQRRKTFFGHGLHGWNPYSIRVIRGRWF